MSDETPGRSAGMSIDGALVRELAELLAETDLSEIEVEDGDRRIRVARVVAAAAPALVPAAVAPQANAAPLAASSPEPMADAAAPVSAGNAVKSPMVGTVYLASDPDTPPFVAVGQNVKAGDTLLIIEAMKVMNPITAPFAGTVTALLIDNAQPVEYDQPLVMIA